MFIAIILAGLSWLVGAVLFEALYKAFKHNHALVPYDKARCCTIWWIMLGMLCLPSGLPVFLVNMPMLWIVGISHIDLAENKEPVITVVEILKNMPAALRKTAEKIRSFIKQP